MTARTHCGTAQIAMHDDPIFRPELGHRRRQAFEQRVGVAQETWQQADADTAAHRGGAQWQGRGPQSNASLRGSHLLLHPNGRLI